MQFSDRLDFHEQLRTTHAGHRQLDAARPAAAESQLTVDHRDVGLARDVHAQLRQAAKPLGFFADRLARNAVFGAFQGEALVGVAGFYGLDGPKTRHKGTLWGMYVKPDARGRGVAEALIEGVIVQARREQVKALQLTVVSANERALRFYRRMGFSAYGVEPRALKHRGAYFDEVLMARFLGEAPAD